MIFPVLELENTLQVNDKTRLNGAKTYLSPDEAAITLVEIEPEAAVGFIDVTNNKYLDWQYATDGVKVVTLRVTTDGIPTTFSKSIEVVTPENDRLFSSDAELTAHEPNILDYVRAGRNSYLDVHRLAQDRVLSWLDERRIWDSNGNKLTKEAIVNLDEVNDWSKFLTLMFIHEGLSNAVEDVFDLKAQKYKKMMAEARNRAALRLDKDGDSVEDISKQDMKTFRLIRQ